MLNLDSSDINNNVKRTKLSNGIRIVTERMPNVRSVSIGAWIYAGSSHETLENNGISHFLEHMLFKGTKKRSAFEIASSLESLGGGLNGSTGKEISLYTAHSLDEHLPIAADVLIDMVQNPKLLKKDIELEKQVILAEISHAKEDPEELLLDYFYLNLFIDHPLGYFIYGSEENVTHFQRDDLYNYLETKYLAERTVFSAAGNVDHDYFVDLVQKYFRGNKNTYNPPQSLALSDKILEYSQIDLSSLQQGHLCIGVRTFGYNDDRKYALVMLDVLLGGGMSSRLFQNIREKYGFAYNIYSFTDIMAETGVFGVYMACDKKKISKSIELIKNEFKQICTEPVPEKELDQVKSQIRGNIILGLESSSRRMRKLGENEIYSAPHLSMEAVLRKVDSVTSQDLLNIANELFQENRFCLTILNPVKN